MLFRRPPLRRDRDGLRDLIQRVSRENPLRSARAPNPWRTADAGVRSRPAGGLRIHGARTEAALAIREDISSKSR